MTNSQPTNDTVLAATSADINEAHVSGSIVDALQFKTTVTGHELATFLIQTLRVFHSQGRRREVFDHHFIAVWDDLVGRVRDLTPGNRVSVFGYMQTHSWADKDTGVRMRRTEIVAENVILHG